MWNIAQFYETQEERLSVHTCFVSVLPSDKLLNYFRTRCRS